MTTQRTPDLAGGVAAVAVGVPPGDPGRRMSLMDRRELRSAGMSRVGTLHGDDGSFDREFWAAIPPAERLELVWDMALEAQEWRGRGGGQSRLQRSVCRLELGRR